MHDENACSGRLMQRTMQNKVIFEADSIVIVGMTKALPQFKHMSSSKRYKNHETMM